MLRIERKLFLEPSKKDWECNGVLNPAEAYKFAVSLEPSIIIPMQYDEKSLKTFIKEGGNEGVKPIEKLTVKKKDLENKKGEIIILDAQ